MKRNLILGIALLVVLAMPLVQAQQQNRNMGIPPDSPFYFMQGWSEGFSGVFRGGDPEFHEELAMRRQAEIQYLEEKGENGLIERLRLRERAQEHQQEAQRVRTREREGNPETGQGPNENQGETQGSDQQGGSGGQNNSQGSQADNQGGNKP